jgi:hypothetical protein
MITDLSARWRRGLRFAVVAVLAAAATWWAAFPVSGGGGGTRVTLVIAIVTAVLSFARLALGGSVARESDRVTLQDRVADQLVSLIGMVAWAELMAVSVLVLEVLHPSRPWHTAVLTVALVSYLVALHLAETAAPASTLRAQMPLLSVGIGLTALSVGAAALPGLPDGPVATLVRIGAIVLALVTAALAIPVWLGPER